MGKCGIPNAINNVNLRRNLVVNGFNAEANEYPFLITLSKDGDTLCGGTILNEQFILTAAHCLKGVTNPSGWTITAGVHNMEETSEHEEVYQVEKIWNHPKYTPKNDDFFDITVIKIKGQFECNNPHIRSVCLPKGEMDHNELRAQIIGWD